MPAVFAFADYVVGRPQTTIFSAFGSFAILVLADFGGSRRSRLGAYLSLACAGAVLVTLGTLCSRSPVAATAAMAAIGLAILLSGVINGQLAAGGFAALLSFILAANVPAPLAAVPDRLAGWALACGAGIAAVMVLWPPRPREELRAASARACAALCDVLEAKLIGDSSLFAARVGAARDAVADLRRRFLATPYRPTGATGSTAALAVLVDELEWLGSLMLPATGEAEGMPVVCRRENREVIAAAAAALRASAASLDGRDGRPDLDRLERAREAVYESLASAVADLPAAQDDAALLSALEPSFRMRELSYAAGEIGANAPLAAESAAPVLDPRRRVGASTRAVGKLAAGYVSLRSVWFRNSVRGATALAIATFVAQQASLQHAFWVVLGTLSVLRSNALGTGSTIVSALAGTAVGVVGGVGLILVIGTDERVLWAVLPVAVLLAAYAPRHMSFAAGQAAFTGVVLVLFNIIQPTGWMVGLVRVEDVTIGFGISLAVGLLLWPRGAGFLARLSVAEAFALSADYVAGAVRALGRPSENDSVQRAGSAARAAAHRLDDAFRQLPAEPGADRLDLESLGTLVAGATRVRLAAQSLLAIAHDGARLQGCAGALDREADALRSWCVALGDTVADSAAPPPPHDRDGEGRRRVLRCVREAVAGGDQAGIRAALGLLFASQHLENLRQLELDLLDPAARLASRKHSPVARTGRRRLPLPH